MPHVTIHYRPSAVQGSQLQAVMPIVSGVVADGFKIPSAWVSVELRPQSEFTHNYRDVELELDALPNDFRTHVMPTLCADLRNALVDHLTDQKIQAQVGTFGRLFAAGFYEAGPA
jgi:hypothetical protein